MTHLDDWLRHENVVYHTFERIRNTGRYTSIQKHVPYRTHGRAGECDILASNNNFINYYEIKGHYCKQSLAHAVEQFKRYKETHPLLHTRFIYVSPERTMRIRL